MSDYIITTDRLRLRRFRNSDLPIFAEINADAKVCEFLPSILSRSESDALAEKIIAHYKKHDFGLWAVEEIGGAEFIGFVGLAVPNFEAHFTPAVEIGWRLSSKYWGKGYATEAAKAVIDYAFEVLKLEEIVSFTTVKNKKSIAVMQRIGMSHSEHDYFSHPRLSSGHPLSRHVLYRLVKP